MSRYSISVRNAKRKESPKSVSPKAVTAVIITNSDNV